MEYTINNETLKLVVDSNGAQMLSVTCDGQEKLWQNENGTWAKHAPILFPHAGKCSIVVNGVHYPDQFHGFARDLSWELVTKKQDEITLLLTSSDFTKQTYPFEFKFYVTYKLDKNSVIISQRFVNIGQDIMYFFVGAHESYKLNEEIKNYHIVFEKDEVLDAHNYPDNSYINIGKGNVLNLDSSLLDNSGSIVLSNINSRYVELRRNSDDKLIASTLFKGFSTLLFWHPKDAKMVCIEPWLNNPDSPNDYEKELKDKDNVISLKPNEETTLERIINYYVE